MDFWNSLCEDKRRPDIQRIKQTRCNFYIDKRNIKLVFDFNAIENSQINDRI